MENKLRTAVGVMSGICLTLGTLYGLAYVGIPLGSIAVGGFLGALLALVLLTAGIIGVITAAK